VNVENGSERKTVEQAYFARRSRMALFLRRKE
jgi:hypothetical protein